MNKLMFALAMSTISVLADDVMVNTGTYQGTTWGNAAMWRSGTVPNGAGTIIDTGEVSDGFYIKMDATNRVIGGITSTFGVMPQKEDQRLYIIPYGYEFREYVEPQINADKSYLYVTSSITFNNNGNGAFIRIDDAFPSDDTTFHSAFRYYFDVPVILEDSLSITHNANHPNTYGLAKFSPELGAEGVFFGGKVSGNKNITSSFKLLTMGTMFNCDKNDFTGNITAESGIVRAKDTSNLPREGTPLGRNNHIYATNGTGRVDLGGFITGEGQTLHLAGKNESFNNVNGVLFSTFAKPGEYSKWCGNVVLEGDTWIGGTLAGDGYPRNQYPVDTHGGIEISGVISDGGDTPRAVHSVNKGGNVFSGDNTFSGGLYLDDGCFTATKLSGFGTGGVYPGASGFYLMRSNKDANVFEADIRPNNGQILRVKIEDGVDCIMPSGKEWTKDSSVKIYKDGQGNLVLTNYVHVGDSSYIMGGNVIFDTSNAKYVKFGLNENGWQCDQILLRNNASLIARGNNDVVNQASWYGRIDDGGAVTMRAENNQILMVMFVRDFNYSYVNLETDSSAAKIKANTSNLKGFRHYSGMIYDGYTWASIVNSYFTPVEDSVYKTSFEGATSDDMIDVKNNETVADGTTVDVVRFNSENGQETIVTLEGDMTIDGGTILMTKNTKSSSVRITGGAIKSNASYLRILNFNPDATIVIESDIAGAIRLVTGGCGKVLLKGAKSYSGTHVHILGGTLGIDCAGALGSAGNCDIRNAVLSIENSMDLALDRNKKISLNVYGTGTICVPNKDDVFYMNMTSTDNTRTYVNLYDGAVVKKTGAGTWKFNTYTIGNSGSSNCKFAYVTSEFLEGTVEGEGKLSEQSHNIIVKDGVTLKGKYWIAAQTPGLNGGGSRAELQSKFKMNIEGENCVVDLNNTGNANFNDSQLDGLKYTVAPEIFKGSGQLVITNSLSTESKLLINGYKDYSFMGKLVSFVNIEGDARGGGFPNAELHLPENVSYISQQIEGRRGYIHWGNISGNGNIYCSSSQSPIPAYFMIGSDRVTSQVPDFKGEMVLKLTSTVCGGPQLVKTGKNAQRLSGAANQIETNPIVRDGSLLIGNDSPATDGTTGTLSDSIVLVGDGKTPQNGTPSLLIDGAYNVANEIRVLPSSPEEATPAIGGTKNADGAEFSGNIKLYRDATFFADTGANVKITGTVSMEGEGNYNITKSGDGTVEMSASVIANAQGLTLSGGKLDLDGELVIPESSLWSIGEYVNLCTDENRKKEFTILTADSIVGKFKVKETLPLGWKVVTNGMSCTLRYGDPPTIILVR